MLTEVGNVCQNYFLFLVKNYQLVQVIDASKRPEKGENMKNEIIFRLLVYR